MNRIKACGLACLIAVGSNAIGAVATCTYKVDNLTTDPGGNVNVSLSSPGGGIAWHQVCSLETTYKSVPVSACKAILANLMIAKATQRDTLWWFDSPTAFNCAATASWSDLKSLGWYWGPALL